MFFYWIAHTVDSQMNTDVPGIQPFYRIFASFWIGRISLQQYKG